MRCCHVLRQEGLERTKRRLCSGVMISAHPKNCCNKILAIQRLAKHPENDLSVDISVIGDHACWTEISIRVVKDLWRPVLMFSLRWST